jgi:hypothetical protein
VSDLKKSKILRAVIFAAAVLGGLFFVALADVLISEAWARLFGSKFEAAIETWVFIYVSCGWLWSWLSRRVWIGREDAGA